MVNEARKKQVQIIQPTVRQQFSSVSASPVNRRKVAAYARVSTDTEEQQTSYVAQIDYYTNYIQSRADWEFVGMYTDEGITGTNTRYRAGFNQMIADALAGKIDLIITKSVSRFARNTVDSLVTVRKLKDQGIEVYFEKENIYTLDGKGELMITIMSSLAQEESRSISENVRWGIRKSFADGNLILPYKHFLGYEKGDDNLPRIVEEEAEVIRLIYRLFLEGKTGSTIAKQLTEMGIQSPGGKDEWRYSTVMSILQNEKYKGAAILQKRITVDFLSKKRIDNDGTQVPKYFIEHSHEPIITPAEFEHVQQEIARRKGKGRRYSSRSVLGSRIICEDCGGYYGPKVWHSNSKYRTVIWQCNEKFRAGEKCTTPHFAETDIKDRFLDAFAQLHAIRDSVLEACEIAIQAASDTSSIDEAIVAVSGELAAITELSEKEIEENARRVQNQAEYQKRRKVLEARYTQAQEKLNALEEERLQLIRNTRKLEWFMEVFSKQERMLDEFDTSFFLGIVDHVLARRDGTLTFVFKDGSKVDA